MCCSFVTIRGLEVESMNHVLFFCDNARMVWSYYDLTDLIEGVLQVPLLPNC